MQINITNGTLTQIEETLSPASGYTLPSSISVSGATSNYNSTTGAITLTNLTQTMSITASGVSSQVNKVSIGTLSLSKAILGTTELSAIWLGNVKLYEGTPAPSGYSVSVYNAFVGETFNIYDGQNNTGTLLGTIAFNQIITFTITSGYIYAQTNGFDAGYTFTKFGSDVGNPATISENASLEISVNGPLPDPE